MDPDSSLGHADVRYTHASAGDIAAIRSLFQEYEQSIGVDLCFQNFSQELASLPGAYAPPDGDLLIAWLGSSICGCVAMKKIDPDTCEMKRLYVQPRARGRGMGHELVRRVLREAASRGYRHMRLDTLPSMGKAIQIYREFGFCETAPYVFNPVAGAIFMEKDLSTITGNSVA